MQINRVLADRRRRQKKRRVYFFAGIALLVLYFIGLGIFAFIVWSPAFRVGEISIQGNSVVSNADIMDLLEASIIRKGDSATAPNNGFKAMLGFHSLFIWPSALPSSTVALIPRLAGITMAKNYFTHSIMVTVTEREPFAVWCIGQGPNVDTSSTDIMSTSSDIAAPTPSDDCFWFDEQGTAFEKTFDTEGNAIFVIHDTSQNQYVSGNLTLGQNVLPPEFIPNLISIVNVLKQSGLDVQDISIDDFSLQQVNVTIANGPMLYFSLRFPADNDLGVIQSLTAKPGFDALQYVDFTVENRAYYK